MNLVFDFQVFTGNSNTCMKISGNQVQRIMTLVAKNKEKVPQFLDLLNAVVKVEELDLPLKRNQSFVMQYFMQFRSDIANVIDQDEAARWVHRGHWGYWKVSSFKVYCLSVGVRDGGMKSNQFC